MKGLNAGSKLSPKYHKDMLSPKVYAKMPILIWYCNSFFLFFKVTLSLCYKTHSISV